ncbi:hypothetical protein F5Y18DRAFT_435442 [Xylariaceae sp. FL1019]|nr:hypothetical protein F5Y18DRAFT_435442 [Xylariaceae sp. FL1019]
MIPESQVSGTPPANHQCSIQTKHPQHTGAPRDVNGKPLGTESKDDEVAAEEDYEADGSDWEDMNYDDDPRDDAEVEPIDFPIQWADQICNDCMENWMQVGFQNPPQYPDTDEETFFALFQAAEERWVNSDDLAELMDALKPYESRLKSINKIVCFGLGSTVGKWWCFDADCRKCDWRLELEADRVRYQYLTALALADYIQRVNNYDCPDVEVFASDPKLTITEIECFPKLRIQILNPYKFEAIQLVDENTFVLSICLPNIVAVDNVIMRKAVRPPVMMLTKYMKEATVPDRLQAFYNDYIRVPCNALDGDTSDSEDDENQSDDSEEENRKAWIQLRRPLGPGTRLWVKSEE